MKRLIMCIFLLLALMVACGNNEEVVEVTEDFDLSTLPESINVETAAQLQDNPDVLFIDVREQWEYDEGHIPGITHIPMGEVESRIAEIPTDKTVILSCRSGNRSGQIYDYLTGLGYDNVHNLNGGISAWEKAGYAVEQ